MTEQIEPRRTDRSKLPDVIMHMKFKMIMDGLSWPQQTGHIEPILFLC